MSVHGGGGLLPSEHADAAVAASDERVAWLTAYALGLAYTAHGDPGLLDDMLDDLESAADADLDRVRKARGGLPAVTGVDEDLRRLADVLLTRTAARMARREGWPAEHGRSG